MSPVPRSTRRRPLQELGLIVVILLLGGILTWRSGSTTLYSTTGTPQLVNIFLNPQNLDNLAKTTSFFAIMAVGATLVIIIGGIDLSVGAIYALAAVSGAKILHRYGPEGGVVLSAGLVVPLAALVCVAVGTACGLVNGLLTVGLRLHPFIITLGTMAIFRNIAYIWAQGQSIGFFPPEFTDGFIRRQLIPGLYPVPMTIMMAVTILGWMYLNYTIGGRLTFAVGGNEIASRYSGVAVARRKVIVFALAGFTAGIAAMIAIGYYGAASSDDGKGYELQAIAAAVVGGASLLGGKGTAWGALLGALLIQMIQNGIIVLDQPQQYAEIITGAAIIVAALLDRITAGLTHRRLLGTH